MQKTLGVLIDKLDNSQKSIFTLLTLNKLSEKIPCYIFYLDYAIPPYINKCAVLSACEAISFRGTLISTDLHTSRILQNCVTRSKYFYVWDLEWQFSTEKWSDFADVYQDERLQLICRSESHQKLIDTCWKTPKHLIDNFNYDQLISIL